METRQGFIVHEPPENSSGVVVIDPKNGTPIKVELQCFAKGPVFLFKGALTAAEAFALYHGGTEKEPRLPSYLCGAVVGQAGFCILTAEIGPLTIASDVESLGLVRFLELPQR